MLCIYRATLEENLFKILKKLIQQMKMQGVKKTESFNLFLPISKFLLLTSQ